MLIYLADLYHDYQTFGGTVPANVGYIAAYCKKIHGDRVDIKLFKEPAALLAAAKEQAPDILGLSNYMWNEQLNGFVMQRLTDISPDMLVVNGGPNIRTDKEGIRLFLNSHPLVDHYILYAGEIPFAGLVGEALARGTVAAKQSDVEGCFRVAGNELFGEAFISTEKDLDYIPSPFLTGLLDPFLEAGYLPLFETNRGCPFSCTYCVWGIAALGKIKTFSMNRVKAEMNYVADKHTPTYTWMLADANFGILPRDVELAVLLRDLYDNSKAFHDVCIWWSKTVTEKTVKIAKTLGKLCEAYVAFQSLDPVVLELIKRSNISVEKLAAFKKEIEGYTNGAFTDILLGLPGETMQSHMNSYYSALRLGFDQIGGGEVRLLPGSEMAETASREMYGLQTKYRISEADIGIYDGELVYELEEVVRATNWISEEEMLKLRSIRALLYGCLTVPGELTPLNVVLLDKNVNILQVMADVIENRKQGTAFSRVLNELEALARDEWFASKEDARRFLSVPENKERIINNPPVKLNFWFMAKLMVFPDAYGQFQQELRRSVLKVAPTFPEIILDDLLRFCAERNYLRAVLQKNFDVEKKIALSVATIEALQQSQYARETYDSIDNVLTLGIVPAKADVICKKMEDPESESVLRISLVLQELKNGMQMSVL